ncbi:hypothetical protein SRABI106_03391 [Rahnella aquatilis]|nr:hypothetical protein SRABI106_03391 [Rahnella aquatilis]
MQVQRDTVGAGIAQIEDVDMLNFQPEQGQIQMLIGARQQQGIDTGTAVDQTEVQRVNCNHVIAGATQCDTVRCRQIDSDSANREGSISMRGGF